MLQVETSHKLFRISLSPPPPSSWQHEIRPAWISVLFLCIAEFQKRPPGKPGGLDSNVANVIDTGKAVAPTLSEWGFLRGSRHQMLSTSLCSQLSWRSCSESSPQLLMEKCWGNAIRHGSQCLEVFHSVDLRQCYTTVLIFMDLALRNRKVRKIHRRFPEIESHGISGIDSHLRINASRY